MKNRAIFFIVLILLGMSTMIANSLYTDALLQRIEKKYGKFAKNRFILLKDIIHKVQNAKEFEKLDAINKFFNKVSYAPDKQVWKDIDYWATPFEFLGKDKGDSEDFVFAKYFTLVNDLKINKEKFYFMYVKSLQKNVSYMVLAYYKTKEAIPLILDMINYKVLPATQRTDIVPIYGFNITSLYENKHLQGFELRQNQKLKTLFMNVQKGKI